MWSELNILDEYWGEFYQCRTFNGFFIFLILEYFAIIG